MRVYDGETLKDTDAKPKAINSTVITHALTKACLGFPPASRSKFSRVFNFDHSEVAANPVHLFYVIEQQVERDQFHKKRRIATVSSSKAI